MTKKFVIMVDDSTPEQQNAVTAYLEGKGGFWHWLSDVWLFATDEEMTCVSIRDRLVEAVPGDHLVVVRVANEDF